MGFRALIRAGPLTICHGMNMLLLTSLSLARAPLLTGPLP
jgi:hypothetical protein